MRILLAGAMILMAYWVNDAKASDAVRVDFPDSETQQKLNKKWQHALPINAQKAIDLGYDLPLPFSISLTPNHVTQGVQLDNLEVGYNGNNLGDRWDLNQINFGEPEIQNTTMQVRVAAWVFPFLQMGVHGGRFSGDTELGVSIPTSIFEGLNAICDKQIHPRKCDNVPDNIDIPAFTPQFQGWNWGFSMNFVGKVSDYTFVIPASLTASKTDDGRTYNKTVMVSPRVGRLWQLNDGGSLFPYVGMTYMHNSGYSGETDALGFEGLSYRIEQSNTKDYSGVIGMNWNINKRYGVAAEYVGGGDRQIVNLIMTFSY